MDKQLCLYWHAKKVSSRQTATNMLLIRWLCFFAVPAV